MKPWRCRDIAVLLGMYLLKVVLLAAQALTGAILTSSTVLYPKLSGALGPWTSKLPHLLIKRE
eukprot:scaffold202048_cov38-Prasinocladus_malaysianus.AAC.1